MLATLLLFAPTALADAPQVLPTSFEANRVYVVPRLRDGRALKLYTDSGGGLFLNEAAVQRLDLPGDEIDDGDGGKLREVELPAFRDEASIPAPLAHGGKLRVMPAAQAQAQSGAFVGDGMLGEAWFGGRVWTWDYPQHRLSVEDAHWQPGETDARVALGFKTDNGERASNFPRITIRVDGQALDVLLDTGATTFLTDTALVALDDRQPATRATSFITATQFDAWHSAHPGWRVIEHAEQRSDAAMIEVPAVDIAASTVGPVWFTRRPDKNFHEFMSSFMDKRVEGAIGGNALRHFRMTVDYPGAAAYFRCTQGCEVTPRSAP